MKLHNTLTKTTEPFKPLQTGLATIYSCGPTVYDHIHIGNLRAFIMADSLRRCLETNGYRVQQVMNYTDVDDKTIARSQKDFPDDSPEEALKNLTRKYEDIFTQDMQLIGNDVKSVKFVRATESIEAMQQLIKQLYDAKFAYLADDGVYFSIQKYRDSGKKYGQLLKLDTKNTSESRINNDEYDKESVHDFALWKLHKGTEPGWEFELDGHSLFGRPGWHIECSAMSSTNLGQPFDIHTGGVDNIFPHHENEIAQSTALQDNYANYFVHNEHLLVDGRKMSKSLNNFFTLQDIEDKGFDPLIFRMLVLQAHYRSQLNFTWESLEAAQNRLQGYDAMTVQQWQTSKTADEINFKDIEEEMKRRAADDMDTPQVLAALSNLTKAVDANGIATKQLDDFRSALATADAILGLNLLSQPDIDSEQKQLLKDRQKARDAKDWATTDAIRDKLLEDGIAVRDTPNGQIWSRP
ncbi:MAG: cysteine--tRNA ligase [Candidatus Saccharimonadales bacterium]